MPKNTGSRKNSRPSAISAQNIFLLLGSLLLTFIILEAAVTMLISLPRLDKHQTEIWWMGKPHAEGTYRTAEFQSHYSFNSDGFRDVERNNTKQEGVCRIAVLGDSFAESLEVDRNQSWPFLLESSLNSMQGKKIEVLNFGLSGGHPSTYYFIAKDYSIKKDPDAVITLLFTGNDISDSHFNPRGRHFTIDGSGSLVDSGNGKDAPLKAIKQLMWKSNLFTFLKVKYDTFLYSVDDANLVVYYGVFLQPYPEEWESAWKTTTRILLEIQALLQQNNVNSIFIFAPPKEQVYPEMWQNISSSSKALAAQQWNFTKPNMILSEFCSVHSLHCIDSSPYFKQKGTSSKNLYFRLDNHWTPEGHKAFAEFLSLKLNSTIEQLCSNGKNQQEAI